MLNQLLPPTIDNTYRGSRLALWILALVLLLRSMMGLSTIFNSYSVAITADGIPLDTFTPAGAQTVVALFALRGLSYLIMCLLGLVVLVRYRSMVPFMSALLLLEHLARYLILHYRPVVRAERPPGVYMNLALLGLMAAGVVLSLRRPGKGPVT